MLAWAAPDHWSCFSTSPARYKAAADQHPRRAAVARQRTQRVRTCGPGRAMPPEAATIASTGRAECCSGSATAQSVAACGINGRRNSAASLAVFMPTMRWTGRSASLTDAPPSTTPAPGLWPPSSHSSQSARQQRREPAAQTLQPRRPFRTRRCRRHPWAAPRRAARRSRCRRCRTGMRPAATAAAALPAASRNGTLPAPDVHAAAQSHRRADAFGARQQHVQHIRWLHHRSPPARRASGCRPFPPAISVSVSPSISR